MRGATSGSIGPPACSSPMPGHGRKEIVDAIVRQAQSPLLTSFSFANEPRAKLAARLVSILPEPLKKTFLFSTGSEAIECAVKLCRTFGVKTGGRGKHVIVSFEKSFHGRTLGAQQTGGIPELKEWIVNPDPGFVQVPFPDGYRTRDTSFESFERALRERGVESHTVAGRSDGNLPGRQFGLCARALRASRCGSGVRAKRRCWCAMKFKRDSAAQGRCGASSNTESCPTWPCSARAFQVRCRLPPWPDARMCSIFIRRSA